MPEAPAALEPGSIFALDKNKAFADTSVETWNTIRSMIREVNELQRQQHAMQDDTQERVNELCRKYPFLEFTKGKPEPGNPYWELKARIHVWSGAIDTLLYCQSKEERLDRRWFEDFEDRYSLGEYKFLWKQPEMTAREMLRLHRYAYGELWAFTQDLKLKNLTPSQEKDRQKLELWVVPKIKDTLIHYELDSAYTCRGREAWKFYDEDFAIATKTVEERIAKEDWQVHGPHKFKFNGS